MPDANATKTADSADLPQMRSPTASHAQIVTGFVQTALSCVIKGVLLTLANFDPETVTKTMARETGRCLGQAVVGDLGQLLAARAGMKKAFEEGMNSVRPQGAGQPLDTTKLQG